MSHPLYIAFIWHMHQPYYRDLHTGECTMPWVRLHGTKDYLDMLAMLEAFPSVHQTFNLVPSLLDQIEEYLPASNRSDLALDLCRKPVQELIDAEKRLLLEQGFMANWDYMVKPYARYYDLLVKRGFHVEEHQWPAVVRRFKAQDLLDLQVWFSLAWVDPWLRAQDPDLVRLEARGSQFSEHDKQLVLDKHLQILGRIIPAYRKAQMSGQVELSTSPYYHPILPLVCDLRAAQVALPHVALPSVSFRHPEDAQWHLAQALQRHEARFSQRPAGLWPSEGSVSEEVVRLAIDHKLRWIATDEEILWRTLRAPKSAAQLYRPHRVQRDEGQLAMVFRDHELSDLIGFVYSQWKASSAAQDFIRRLGAIHEASLSSATPWLVSVILDGENAWEFYPRDAEDFFHALYGALSDDPRFRLVTVSEFLDRFPLDEQPSLPTIYAGSWIDGNFATWIGQPEKNAAWEHLARVRDELATITGSEPSAAHDMAWRSFYAAEGSDWTWWLGDTHSSAQDAEFDRLFRMHLANVYRFLEREVPAWLSTPITTTVVRPAYEPTAFITPTIDGLETTYYEWLYAGRLDLRKSYAAIHRGKQVLHTIHYGLDHRCYYVRIDGDMAALGALKAWRIQLELPERNIEVRLDASSATLARPQGGQRQDAQLAYACRRTMELAIPRELLDLKAGECFQLRVTLFEGDESLERYPGQGAFRVSVPPDDFQGSMWSV